MKKALIIVFVITFFLSAAYFLGSLLFLIWGNNAAELTLAMKIMFTSSISLILHLIIFRAIEDSTT